MNAAHARVKYACYMTNITMAVVCNLPPLLFLGFRTMYGISYSLLGSLVLVNFVTQLTVDLIFSFFSHKFNIPKTVKGIPVLAVFGLVFYAVWPYIFPDHVYAGLLIGTVLFSGASGFAEVLISPVVAALPARDPDKEMSKLHAMYAWGAVGVIVVSTVFLLLCGKERWQLLMLLLALVPIAAWILFAGAQIPHMDTPKRVSGALRFFRNKQLYICVAAIFLGGAAECTMAQWCSGYVELTLGVPKIWGDIGGAALFAVMLGLGRTLYAKIGKQVERVMLWGAVGATVCYIVAALSDWGILGLLACGLTGLCTSMMWPGSLITASERFPSGGVFIYAMMAAGGDLGAAVGPQMVGVLTDTLMASPVAQGLSVSPEQFGMKCSMLAGAVFPLLGILVFGYIKKHKSN